MSKFDPICEDVCRRLLDAEDMETVRVILAVGRARLVRAGMESDELTEIDKDFEETIAGMEKKLRVDARRREAEITQRQLRKMREEVRARWDAQEKILIKLRATRDAKKAKLAALIKDNQRLRDEIKDMKELHVLNQERIRLDTIALESRRADIEQTTAKALEIVADFDQKMANAPWRKEMEQKAAERREIEAEIAQLQADIKAFDDEEELERIAAESEEKLPRNDFCVQFAKLQVKNAEMQAKQAAETVILNELKEQEKQRRLLEDDTFPSQMDCTQALLDYDDDLEPVTQRTRKSQPLAPPQVPTVPRQLSTVPRQESTRLPPESTREQLVMAKQANVNAYVEQQVASISAQSPAHSTTSSASNENCDDSLRDNEDMVTFAVPHPNHQQNPDESVDEAAIEYHTSHAEGVEQEDEPMESNEANEDSQAGEMEEDGGESVCNEEEEEEQQRDHDEENEDDYEGRGQEEEEEGQEEVDAPNSQESEAVTNNDEVDEEAPFGHNVMNLVDDDMGENDSIAAGNVGEREGIDPDVLLNMSVTSEDPGNDFFNMVNNDAQRKQTEAGSAGASPSGGGPDFFNMFGAGGGEGGGEGDADTSKMHFSFNFAEGGEQPQAGGDGGGESSFNFFGF